MTSLHHDPYGIAPIAHSVQTRDGTVREPHALDEHLRAVGALAAELAKHFGAEWARLAGNWHDLGKYRPGFQKYLRQTGDVDAHIEGKISGRDKTHSAAGALWAVRQLNEANRPYGHILAYLIAGHHAGLSDWDGGLKERLQSEDAQREFDEALAAGP